MKKLKIAPLLSLLLVVNLWTTSALAQQPSTTTSSASELERLKKGFAAAINQVADLQEKLLAAEASMGANAKEAEAAKRALALSQMETEALRRAIAAGIQAEDALKRRGDAEQAAALAYEHRALSAETRVDQLQGEVGRANKRTILGTIGGIITGIFLGRRMP